jgi:hypothetical protein
MSANYTPNLGEYTELTPFRYWCQKVMPLVYDDSLSYYELLCKVVDYLNKTMHDVDTLHTDVIQLHTAYIQLQQYVNTYFENLDLQTEIDRKLDKMAESGALLNVIKPSVIDSVNKWLTANITNPSNPPIDKSLTIENAAADSKVTGDKINSLTQNIVNRDEYLQSGQLTVNMFDKDSLDYLKGFHQVAEGAIENSFGYYDADDTVLITNTNYNLYNFIPVKQGDIIYRFTDGKLNNFFKMSMAAYDENKILLGVFNATGNATIPKDDRIKYVRVPVSDPQVDNIVLSINIIPKQYIGFLDSSGIETFKTNLLDLLLKGQLTINEFDVNSSDYSKGYNQINANATTNAYGYYDANKCHLETNSTFNLYNYIDINKSDCIFRFYDNNIRPYNQLAISVYDKNKEFLGTFDTKDFTKNDSFYIPNDPRIKYIRVPVSDSSVYDYMLTKNIKPKQYIPYLTSEYLHNILSLDLENQWYGKTWYAYGTSLTNIDNEGKYPKYVKKFSGMNLVNKAISGGGLVASNGNIRKAIMNTTDGKLNADLITLETGANDTGAVLGTIYDTGDDTYCGALNQCIRYLQANTNAQIVVISSTSARYEYGNPGDKYTPDKTFGSDKHTKYDQWKAIEEVCKLNSVHYIPMGEHSGFGFARMDTSNLYIADQIHHTELGGYNLGKFVWSKLKDIPCWFFELPNRIIN